MYWELLVYCKQGQINWKTVHDALPTTQGGCIASIALAQR